MRFLFLLCLICSAPVFAAPEMDLSRGSAIASLGSDSVTGADAGAAVTLNYVIANAGTTLLNVGGVSVSGETNCSVSIVQPPVSIAPGTSAGFQLIVTPIASGTFSFAFAVANDDSDEQPYSVSVGGVCTPQGAGCQGPPPREDTWMGCAAVSSTALFPLAPLALSLLALLKRRRLKP